MSIVFTPSVWLRRRQFPAARDALAGELILGVVVALGVGSVGTFAPLATVTTKPISLDPTHLPLYAVRTVLRMLGAMLRRVPHDLDEACSAFRFPAWQRFWRLEVPFAMPGLVWNMMMSMSGGWFFVVASEAITVGNRNITLPGIGSYVAAAIPRQDLRAIGWAILTMTLVIIAKGIAMVFQTFALFPLADGPAKPTCC